MSSSLIMTMQLAALYPGRYMPFLLFPGSTNESISSVVVLAVVFCISALKILLNVQTPPFICRDHGVCPGFPFLLSLAFLAYSSDFGLEGLQPPANNSSVCEEHKNLEISSNHCFLPRPSSLSVCTLLSRRATLCYTHLHSLSRMQTFT